VLDVKWGHGAFMKTVEQARDLARTLVEIGKRMGKGMTALITDMNQPLGRTAGNALEIRETVEALRGQGPRDLIEITLELGAHMLLLANVVRSREEAVRRLEKELRSGAAFEKFLAMVRLHGGDAAALQNPDRLCHARYRKEISALRGGFVAQAHAECIGKACVVLGAGRRKVEDRVDHAVGASDIVKVGERVAQGQPLLVLHANEEDRLMEAAELAASAFQILETPAAILPLIGDVIR